MTSACIASSVATVSRSVSPLVVLDDEPPTFITSAPSRLPANSKELRVRVDASKKRFRTVLPLSVGTLRTGLRVTSRNVSAVPRMRSASGLLRSRTPEKVTQALVCHGSPGISGGTVGDDVETARAVVPSSLVRTSTRSFGAISTVRTT